MNKKILLFAGTTEGRLLAGFLQTYPIVLHICVATDYGKDLLSDYNVGSDIKAHTTISSRRLDLAAMTALINAQHFDMVIDATHPHAVDVTKNITQACKNTQTSYLRILRNVSLVDTASDSLSTDSPDKRHIFVNSATEALTYLNSTEGPIFVATGSKELSTYMQIEDAPSRIYARILPNADVLNECSRLGLKNSHLLCMQGPFDDEMNTATINHIRKRWTNENPTNPLAPMHMITKDSGNIGGYSEKLRAADSCNITSIIISCPSDEDGISLEEAYIKLDAWINEPISSANDRPLVSLIGVGMDSSQLTLVADRAIRSADIIIGAKRMLEITSHYGKPGYCSYDYPAIVDFMLEHTEYKRFAVLFSGDIGFYSGASIIRSCLKGLDFDIEALSGISAPIHFINSIGKVWQDVKLISRHGQKANVISHVRTHEKLLVLLGKSDDISDICKDLIKYGMGETNIYIASNLMQPDEVILSGHPADFVDKSYSALSMIYIESPVAQKYSYAYGLHDDAFIRGLVPMTKSEIRSIVLSKLALTSDAILYDIGAGTGSVSVEAARFIPKGQVYAIEKNPAAIELIEANCIKHQVDNVHTVQGIAPECISADLAIPTHAFIGGSFGHLFDIIKLLYRLNPHVRIVITAITIETLTAILSIKKALALPEPEILMIQVSNAKAVGNSHLMQGQNPVYIIKLN